MTIINPFWASVAVIVWCMICCACAWWAGAKYGVRRERASSEQYTKERDIEWAKLLADSVARRDRQWIDMIENSQDARMRGLRLVRVGLPADPR